MHKGFSKNEYGTEISLHECDSCGTEFSACPAQDRDIKCMGLICDSYDESRDVESLMASGHELKSEPIIKRH